MSEKLDGVRAYWDGTNFYSRQGNIFHAPPWFIQDLPKDSECLQDHRSRLLRSEADEHCLSRVFFAAALDGELWCGRGLFQRCVSIVKKTAKTKAYQDDWKYVTYLVFDAPTYDAPYEQR